MAYPHRCRSCNARKTFRRKLDGLPPEDHPRCSCGARDWKLDRYRHFVEGKKNKCLCDGRAFPHRKGENECRHRDPWRKMLDQMSKQMEKELGVRLIHVPSGKEPPF